mmetsp:Transcript_24963/g.68840  ORF Transcript_24963/g.68840 Transcript_24963/m.68840 type:complete len:300 (+) Transcript_24963:260-1159(+)
MCGPTQTIKTAAIAISSAPSNDTPVSSGGGHASMLRKFYPLHPSVALVVMATVFLIFPSSLYVNRGFTVWFHWASVFYLLTQSRFVQKFLILSGISICMGWYACLVYELVVHGRFFDALYKNMPAALTQYMLLEEDNATHGIGNNNYNNNNRDNNALNATASVNGTLDLASTHSLLAMLLSHVLDLLGHPLLTYYFWRKNKSSKRATETHPNQNKPDDHETIFTWPVILTAYCYSRIWSLFHTYYNYGFFAYFYVGFDVYVLDDLDSWYPAYLMETLFYASVVTWKLIAKESSSKLKSS